MNPIPWQSWGEAAFDAARTADKPVLLSISAVWCHWCHVMDHTSYSDPAVIETIRERYVAIRVDNDVRPDVNIRYNQGGWPTTAFLTPEGDLIAGATYLPPEQMASALARVADFYRDNRATIRTRASEIRERLQEARPERRELSAASIDATIDAIERTYDQTYGGFGETQKFPMTDVLRLLWLEYRVRGEQRLYDMLARTMLAMAEGGMYDHVEGGFFRYSTTPDWSIPHFEKMAEDHAGLIRVLAELSRATRNPKFHATLRSAAAYVRATLRDGETGLFAGSQDADESYYALPLDERRAREAPFVDRRSYTNWSAALAAAMLAAGEALEDERLVAESLAGLHYLREHVRDGDGLLAHVRHPDGRVEVHGLLTDQAAYFAAAIDAHEIAGDETLLREAVPLAGAILRDFRDESGALRDHAGREAAVASLERADYPPRENAIVADALLRLAVLTEDERYRDAAIGILEALSERAPRFGLFGAAYAGAVRRALAPPLRAELRGSGDAAELREALRSLPDPLLCIRTVADDEPLRVLLCRGTVCAEPAYDRAGVRTAFERLDQLPGR